jgi:hypothetical protein
MQATIFLEKNNFDKFLVWLNRLDQGIIIPCPIQYQTRIEGLTDPMQVLMDGDEYAMVQDAEQDITNLKVKMGITDVHYTPEPYDADKLLMSGILKNAERWDLAVDVVSAAIEIAQQVKGITPLEAMIIAEREVIAEANGEDAISNED